MTKGDPTYEVKEAGGLILYVLRVVADEGCPWKH